MWKNNWNFGQILMNVMHAHTDHCVFVCSERERKRDSKYQKSSCEREREKVTHRNPLDLYEGKRVYSDRMAK